jgi:hypothetical protein
VIAMPTMSAQAAATLILAQLNMVHREKAMQIFY